MFKQVTCAIVIKHKNTVLLAHSTNELWTKWNFPKGIADEGETHIDAAIRELEEETGLIVTADKLTDIGHYKYLEHKDIHLYLYESDTDIDAKNLVCRSMFFCNKKNIDRPECDSFRMVSFDKLPAYLAPKISELYYPTLKDIVEK